MIIIVDYGTGNLGSIQNMLKKIGVKSRISSDLNEIVDSTKLILPGVGAFDTGMKNLERLDLIGVLNHKALIDGIPILGICLGMQLMCKSSSEGEMKGLSWFDADLINFENTQNLRIPHMNWAYTKIIKKSKLVEGMPKEMKFYHVHSYHVDNYPEAGILESDYHGYKFVSALECNNLVGVQFHPEKSHKYGMELLHNFAENYK